MNIEEIYKSFDKERGYRFRTDVYRDEAAYISLVAARSVLLRHRPFFGIIALSLVLVETRLIPTLAVDGFHFFYNPKFVKQLTLPERQFGVGHEVLHVVLKQCLLGRLGGRDPLVWNYAIDYMVNLALTEDRIGKFIEGGLLDQKYANMSAEEIYDYLEKHPEEQPKSDGSIHIYVVVGDDTECDNKGNVLRISRGEFEKWQSEFADVLSQAISAQQQAEQKGAGKLPAGLAIYLDGFFEAKVNWRDVLRHYVEQIMMYRYSYTKPNKALFSSGITIPGFRDWDDQIDICIGIDSSGSIAPDQLKEFLSEMRGIIEAFPEFHIRLWCFDGDVDRQNAMEITKDNEEDFDQFQLTGGGGTTFESNWHYMEEIDVRPKLFVMFTDGMPNSGWGDPDYCDTLFLINVGQHMHASNRPQPPFGIVCYYDDYRHG